MAKKIVNHWSYELIKKPYLHDKIEFDISDGSYDAFTNSKVLKKYKMFRKIPLAYNMQVSRKYPVSLVHFVTNRCNARCSFCFIDFDNPENNDFLL